MSGPARTLALEGAVTFATYNTLRETIQAFAAAGGGVLDWQRVAAVDSSALSLIFHAQRLGVGGAPSLRHQHLPRALDALAELYGVNALIAAADA